MRALENKDGTLAQGFIEGNGALSVKITNFLISCSQVNLTEERAKNSTQFLIGKLMLLSYQSELERGIIQNTTYACAQENYILSVQARVNSYFLIPNS